MFFINMVFLVPHNKFYKVVDIKSPLEIVLSKGNFTINDLETFDSRFTTHNKKLAETLGISETEAFVLGNLGKYWASNLLKGRYVYIKDKKDLIFVKYSYRQKFKHSAFCIVNNKITNQKSLEYKLKQIRRNTFRVLDLDNGNIYKLDDEKIKTLENFLILRKSQLPQQSTKNVKIKTNNNVNFSSGNVKLLITDFTDNLKPTRKCDTNICKEILSNINLSTKSIDIAIYGYSNIPEIEKALKEAIKRNVKIRLVYDSDKNGNNIYPNTNDITKLIPLNQSDKNSPESNNIMHNKFYIFDEKVIITGSANLSHTDMSGFNTNSVLVIKSPEIANIYKKEFEQMYEGKFHNEKISNKSNKFNISEIEMDIFFSPQDKALTNAILPIINNAKKYIYIPTFVLTEKRITQALINAGNRGVDVKIIMDAVNASIKHTKHWELRNAKIPVKTENYAGKMHSKSMIVDDEYTIVGSMNFSNSGENKNDENLIVIRNKNITKTYKDFFLYQWSMIDNKWLERNVRAESLDSIGSCYDGIDNNYDGLIDSNDPACKTINQTS